MKRKKVVSMILAVTMLAGTIMTGCGKETKDTGKTSSSANEPMEILMMKGDVSKYTDDQTIKGMLEEKYNIKIKAEQLPEEQDAITLRIASGDIPELLWTVPFGNYREYVDQGVLAEVPVDMIKEYAPKYYEWVTQNLGESAFGYTDIEGKNYALPAPWTLASDQNVMGWREDILKDSGVDKIPETLDEMEDALRKIKDAKGIAPYSAEGLKQLSSIYGAYGTYLCYYEKDGEIVYGPITDNAKEAVTRLHTWYEEGLLDPEFMINKFDNLKEKWIGDKAAVTEYQWWHFLPKEAFFDGQLYEPRKDDETFKIAVSEPPAGVNGEKGFTQLNPLNNAGLCFGKQIEEQPEKLQKYLEIINDVFDRETMDLINYGVEGETYNYNEETGVEWIPPYDDEEKRTEYGMGMYMITDCFNDYDLQAKYMTQPKYLEQRNNAQACELGIYDVLEPLDRPVYDDKSEILDKIYTNAHIDFITGARDISEWDTFVEEWLSAGGQDVLNEAQEAYKKIK